MQFIGDPEEFAEKLQKQYDQAMMSSAADSMALDNFIEGLSTDNMVTFRKLLITLEGNPDLVPYFIGVTETILKYVHKKCVACGEDHHDAFHLEEDPDESPST